MKVSEITKETILNHIREDADNLEDEDISLLEAMKKASIEFCKSQTGLTQDELDEHEDENFESFVMDEEEEDDMVDDLDDLLSERPKERRSHSEKDDTFQVDYIDLD